MINILIVDDHELVGEGTKNILAGEPEFNLNLIISSEEASQHIHEHHYDLYIFDLNMPERNGFELTQQVLSVDPDAKILIFTGLDVSTYFNYMIESGVSGFISKTDSKRQLIRAVWCAIEGQAVIPIELLAQLRRTNTEIKLSDGVKISLSEKEEKILIQVAKGLTNEEIAENLYMSKRNVERYLTTIFKKMRVSSRGEAIIKGKKLEFIPEIMV